MMRRKYAIKQTFIVVLSLWIASLFGAMFYFYQNPPVPCVDVLIGTVPREGSPTYLSELVSSLNDLQAQGELFMCLRLNIFNLRPSKYNPVVNDVRLMDDILDIDIRVFDVYTDRFSKSAKTKRGGKPCKEESDGVCLDLKGWVQLDSRKRTLDFGALLDFVRQSSRNNGQSPTHWSSQLVIVEDDFLVCPSIASRFQSVLSWAQEHEGQFSGLRFSHGFSGLLIHFNDIQLLINHISTQFNSLPLDDLLGRFWTGAHKEGARVFNERPFVTYRYNLLEHVGSVTSLPSHDAADKILNTNQCMITLDQTLFKQYQLYWEPAKDPEGLHSEFFNAERTCFSNPDFSPCIE